MSKTENLRTISLLLFMVDNYSHMYHVVRMRRKIVAKKSARITINPALNCKNRDKDSLNCDSMIIDIPFIGSIEDLKYIYPSCQRLSRLSLLKFR